MSAGDGESPESPDGDQRRPNEGSAAGPLAKDGSRPDEAHARRALALFYSDQRPEGLALAAKLLKNAANQKTPSAASVRGSCRFVIAAYALSMGNYAEVARHTRLMESDAAEYDLSELRVQALRLMGANERHAGRYSMSFRRVSEAVDEAATCDDHELVVATTLDAANGLLHLNGPAEALPLLCEIDAMCASDELQKYRVRVQYYFAKVALALDQFDEALRHLALAREAAMEHGARLGAIVLLDVVDASLSRKRGAFKDVRWFVHAHAQAEKAEAHYPKGELLYEWALRSYRVENDLAQARDQLTRVLKLLDAEHHLRTRVTAYLILAEIHEAFGDEGAAESALKDAIALSVEERAKQLKEMGDIVLADTDRSRLGRAGAADHARRALVEEMVRQLGRTNAELKERVSEAVHDLRSPLTVLKLVTSSAAGLQDNEGVTRAASQQIADIISVLDRNASSLPQNSEPFAVVVRECLPLFSRHAAYKNSRVVLTHGTSAPVPCHVSVVRRIVFNLVENALKFSPPGSEIRLVLSERNSMVVLEVLDEGPGFESAATPARPTAGEPSTGLGLEIVRRLLAESRGTLRLVDHDGGGLAEVAWPLQT